MTSTFSLLNHAVPKRAKPWQDYVAKRLQAQKGDLSIVDALDSSADLPTGQANRFRWICSYLVQQPAVMYGAWLDTDVLLDEVVSYKGVTTADFHKISQSLGLYMLRRELKNIPYYLQLRAMLASRVWHNDNVLVLGPTAGGEVEIAEDVGGFPFVVMDESRHVTQCYARLLHDRVVFEPTTLVELQQAPQAIHFVIITPYVPDQKAAVRIAYDIVGLHGWILFSTECQGAIEEAERLSLVRRLPGKPAVALFFKFPGLSATVGDASDDRHAV